MIPQNAEARTPGEAAAFDALTLAWVEIRAELRTWLESEAMATLCRPPETANLSSYERQTIRRQIAALQSIKRAMPDLPEDQHPAWLNDAIDGRIEI